MAYPYVSPATNFVKRDPYGFMRPSDAPRATGGKAQPRSPHGPSLKPKKTTVRKVKVKAPPIPKAPAGVTENALLDAAVRSRFAPQEQALNQQLQQNTRYSSGMGDWYSQALKEIQGLKAQGQQSSQQTLQGVQSYASQPTLPNATDQQAATARNNLNAEFASSFGQQSQANSDAMNRLAAALLTQQGNSQSQANIDRQRLLQAQGGLGQQKADYKLTYGAQQQAAQSKALNDQAKIELAAKALKVKLDTLNNVQVPLARSLANDRTQGQKVARTKTRETKRQNAIGNVLSVNKLALDAYKAAHPNAGKKGAGSNSTYSKSKVQGFRANWDYAQATAKQLKDKKSYTDKSGKPKPVTEDVAYSALLGATKDPDIAKAASLAAFGKQIPAGLRHRLALKGVHPPKVKKQQSLGQIVGSVLQNLGK